MPTITINLTDDVYRYAKRAARETQQPIEAVVEAWTTPPYEEMLSYLDTLPDEDVIALAKSRESEAHYQRVEVLTDALKWGRITPDEQHELEQLVDAGDIRVLCKAHALYILKQRNLLPEDLDSFLNS